MLISPGVMCRYECMSTTSTTDEALTWHSVAEAAQLTGMSERTIWRRVRADEIPNRTTDDHRRLVGLRPDDLSTSTAKLATVAASASGAMRAAHSLSDAIRIIEAQTADRIARADQRAQEAAGQAQRAERAVRVWRAVTVALSLGVAAVAFLSRQPSTAVAQTDSEAVAWHPPLLP
jgi:hypothetical protein